VTVGTVVLVAALAVGVAVGLLKRRYDGRFRARLPNGYEQSPGHPSVTDSERERPADHQRLTSADLGGAAMGERATLVQFTSAFCAPCRATRQLLADIAAKEPGVAYAEIDAESHLDLVRRLRVRRTPTVLVVAPDGVITSRASGLPRRHDVLAALGHVGYQRVR
jgi:thiol-disulfide isomerase/thioredoxin